MFILSMTSCIVAGGHGEPAMMPVRREDMSYLSKSGWLSSAMYMVGTPYTAVAFSRSMARRTISASKSSIPTMVQRCVRMAMMPSTQPKQWKYGTGRHTRSLGVSFMPSPMKKPSLRMLRCVSMTPLGKPVVPLVYCIMQQSLLSKERVTLSSSSASTYSPSKSSSGTL